MGDVSGDPPNDDVAQGELEEVLDFMKGSPARRVFGRTN
jgi:hypothetical protein